MSTRAQNSDQPKGGTVLEMSGANTEVPVGTTVTLVVSTGQPDQPEQVVVPNVVGQPPRTTAEQMIYGDALQPAVREEFSDQPVGTVIDTDPGQHQRRPGSTVTLIVSKGPPEPGNGDNGNGNGNGNSPSPDPDESESPGIDWPLDGAEE